MESFNDAKLSPNRKGNKTKNRLSALKRAPESNSNRNGMSESPKSKRGNNKKDRDPNTNPNNREENTNTDDDVENKRNAKHSEKKKINENTLANRIGKQTARVYIEQNTMFPDQEQFNISNNPKSFFGILKSKLHEKNYIIKENKFVSFFFRHTNVWFKSCNDARNEIVRKCKDRYFGKRNNL